MERIYLRFLKEVQELYTSHKKTVIIVGGMGLFGGVIYLFSLWQDQKTYIYYKEKTIDFKEGKIFDGGQKIYQRKNRILSKKIKNIEENQKGLLEQLDGLRGTFKEFQEAKNIQKIKPNANRINNKEGQTSREVTLPPLHSSSPLPLPSSSPSKLSVKSVPKSLVRRKNSRRPIGPFVVSFPVKEKKREKMEVKLPSGSFVRAKLLTGVEASESKAIPILLQADYAFIGPNKTRIDLSGCFLLAKSKGNLSIERVEAQVKTLSCVSKSGRMFERAINGFITDAKDNSFAVIGSVNSKQDRVAAMAFLSSIVEGVGKAIQQTQVSSQSSNAVGSTTSMVTGDQGKYMASSGMSHAAGLVTQWYLKHAQNLLPTINIGSGQEVWVVMQESVALPNWYFKRPKSSKGRPSQSEDYSYISGLLN